MCLLLYLSLLYHYVTFSKRVCETAVKEMFKSKSWEVPIMKLTVSRMWHSRKNRVRFAPQGNLWQSLEAFLVVITTEGTADI